MIKVRIAFFLFVAIFCPFCNYGQNFVMNGSFEDLYNCQMHNHGRLAKYWCNTDSLKYAGEIFSTCPGINNVPLNANTYQFARHGNNFNGATLFLKTAGTSLPPLRAYLRNRLRVPLQHGSNYCVTFHLNISNSST